MYTSEIWEGKTGLATRGVQCLLTWFYAQVRTHKNINLDPHYVIFGDSNPIFFCGVIFVFQDFQENPIPMNVRTETGDYRVPSTLRTC